MKKNYIQPQYKNLELVKKNIYCKFLLKVSLKKKRKTH